MVLLGCPNAGSTSSIGEHMPEGGASLSLQRFQHFQHFQRFRRTARGRHERIDYPNRTEVLSVLQIFGEQRSTFAGLRSRNNVQTAVQE